MTNIEPTDRADEPIESGEPNDAMPAAGPTSPGEIASAARSCFVILLVLAGILVLLCIAFAVSQIV